MSQPKTAITAGNPPIILHLDLRLLGNKKYRTPLISGARILLIGHPTTAITAGNPP